MKPSDFQERVKNKFDYYCKKAIQAQQKNYLRDIRTLSKKEVNFSAVGNRVLRHLSTTDTKPSETEVFTVNGIPVEVENNLLGEALKILTNRKREILLLHFFLDLSDSDIAHLLDIHRSTVYRHRMDALATIKQFMEEKQ